MSPVRVLIVDDSATIRRLLSAILARDPGIEVVGEAPEPAVAREMIKALNPDVLTLDVEMPGMNGLDFLERIMRLRPMPVVMVSTLTAQGADVTLDALALGAVDYFAKPTQDVAAHLHSAADELIAKVKAAAAAAPKLRAKADRPIAAPLPPGQAAPFARKLIAIGASTGGVEALIELLSHFPADCPPTLITQHMPAGFTASFARRLDRLSAPKVVEAVDGAVLEAGRVHLAPGGAAHLEVAGRTTWRCRLTAGDTVSGHRPSVDRLFHAVAAAAGGDGVGVLLTGMGRDGAAGLLAMKEAGALTIGQDEASAIVYGMPRAAFELGAVQRQLPLTKIGGTLMALCRAPALMET